MTVECIVTRGTLGWGNRKSGTEAYGPGGRWDRPPGRSPMNAEHGDLLGDHLADLGVPEGAYLIVVAVPSRFRSAFADVVITKVKALVAELEADGGERT